MEVVHCEVFPSKVSSPPKSPQPQDIITRDEFSKRAVFVALLYYIFIIVAVSNFHEMMSENPCFISVKLINDQSHQ